MSDAVTPRPKIDIVASVRSAYTIVIENWRLAVGLAWLPFLILVGADIVGSVLGNDRWFVQIPTLLIDIAAWAVFLVRWHRFILLGETVTEAFFPPGWRRYVWTEMKFCLLVMIGLLLLFAIAIFVGAAIGLSPSDSGTIAGIGVSVIVVGFFGAGVSLAFPGAAINQRVLLLTEAWDLVSGNYWRLVACLIACYVPFAILSFGIGELGDGSSIRQGLFIIVRQAVLFADAAVVASLLSHVYRQLSSPPPQAEPSLEPVRSA